MTLKILFIIGMLHVFLSPMQAVAADAKFCRESARSFAEWIATTRSRLGPQSIDRVQIEAAKSAEFSGVVNRMRNRANMLLDKNITQAEAFTDLYALCMSIT